MTDITRVINEYYDYNPAVHIGPFNEPADLQNYYWPVGSKFKDFNATVKELLSLNIDDQRKRLAESRHDYEKHGEYINRGLSQIYDYFYGYEGAPLYNRTDDDLEIKLQQIKILLERELMNWLPLPDFPKGMEQMEAAKYINHLLETNSGWLHELYKFIEESASKKAVMHFLLTETVRTEVVDDETALMLVGTQGPIKQATVSNCWDECGNGVFENFHTWWLRMMLEELDAWKYFEEYRENDMPWFAMISSNAYNMCLTRPGYKYAAYGDFIVGESWVPPHFARILKAMKRVGLDNKNLTIYFEKHADIDPHHTKQLLDGFAYQKPALVGAEVDNVVLGSYIMITAATCQYERMLPYLASMV